MVFKLCTMEETTGESRRGCGGRDSLFPLSTLSRNDRDDDSAMRDTRSSGNDVETTNSEEKVVADGYDICGYAIRASAPAEPARKRLTMDAASVKEQEKAQSFGSKVHEEIMKVLFGPSDAKTPDEEKYEVVEEEEVTRGVGHAGILWRFSMWATLGFAIWVFAGGQAQVECPELFPSIRERDPVSKVIKRSQGYQS